MAAGWSPVWHFQGVFCPYMTYLPGFKELLVVVKYTWWHYHLYHFYVPFRGIEYSHASPPPIHRPLLILGDCNPAPIKWQLCTLLRTWQPPFTFCVCEFDRCGYLIHTGAIMPYMNVSLGLAGSLSIMTPRFIHIEVYTVCVRMSFLFKAKWYSTVCPGHIFVNSPLEIAACCWSYRTFESGSDFKSPPFSWCMTWLKPEVEQWVHMF